MKIKTIACVGAGLVGQGWVTLFSAKGYDVLLHDLDEETLQASVQKIQSNLEFMEKNRLLKTGASKIAINKLITTTNLADAVSRADYIQESVQDDPELKKQVFKEIDADSKEDAIIASSASGLLMSEIQTATRYPSRCVLAHPMLPVHLIPLVEIVGGDLTSPETVSSAYEFMKSLGKTPVLLKKEVSGYIVNRLQAALVREAFDLIASGVANAKDVDKAFCSGIGLRDPFIGPLLRVHLAGNGIERFIKNYKKSYEKRWESMADWTSIPVKTADSVIKSVKELPQIQSQSMEEIKAWRDDQLIKMLKILI